jgi:hypothetical protein
MKDVTGFPEHGIHRFVHMLKIRLGIFRLTFGLLQLYGGNQLHRLGNLPGALYTFSAPLDISHGSHVTSHLSIL